MMAMTSKMEDRDVHHGVMNKIQDDDTAYVYLEGGVHGCDDGVHVHDDNGDDCDIHDGSQVYNHDDADEEHNYVYGAEDAEQERGTDTRDQDDPDVHQAHSDCVHDDAHNDEQFLMMMMTTTTTMVMQIRMIMFMFHHEQHEAMMSKKLPLMLVVMKIVVPFRMK